MLSFNSIYLWSCLLALSIGSVDASIKSMAMGFTGVAYSYDAQAAVFNPAGMMSVGDRLDVTAGFFHNVGKSRFKGSEDEEVNGTFHGTKLKFWPCFGFGINKLIRSKLAVGFVVKPYGLVKSCYNKAIPVLGTSPLGTEVMQMALSPTIAIRIAKKHDIGFSLNIALARIKYKGFESFRFFSLFPDRLTNRGYDYSRGLGVTFGYQLHITPKITFGAMYQPQIHMSTYHKYKGLKPCGRNHIPSISAAGICCRFTSSFLGAFAVTWVGLNNIPAIGNPPFPPDAPLGHKNGPGAGLRDITLYGVGFEYQLFPCLAVRAGASFSKTPVRRRFALCSVEAFNTVEKTVSCGATWTWKKGWEFSFAAVHGFRNKVHSSHGLEMMGGGSIDIYHQYSILLFGFGKCF